MNFKIGIMLGLAILCSMQETDAAFGWYWYTAKQNNKRKNNYSEHENALSFSTKTPKEAIEAVELSVQQGFSEISEDGELTEGWRSCGQPCNQKILQKEMQEVARHGAAKSPDMKKIYDLVDRQKTALACDMALHGDSSPAVKWKQQELAGVLSALGLVKKG